ncbi:MAG: glycosyltransferase family 2 protein [Opitutaceae bacterium]|nr:glycosyltransferase family 2 protein [Opitutaceae bacterium]
MSTALSTNQASGLESPPPIVSIVIPAFNRIDPLRLTLRSAVAAIGQLGEPVEVLLIDDGSEPPLATSLAGTINDQQVRILRQPNRGSIVARQTGLKAALGTYVLFLDSDDLIAPEKLRAHVAQLRTTGADISYDDVGAATTDPDQPVEVLRELPFVSTVEELVLRVQPLPHGPVYRREYLRRALQQPVIPPLRECDAAGDVWLYYNLSIHPARLVKVTGLFSLIGVHEEGRYSQHWEKLGFAALGIMEAFMRNCPNTPATDAARTLVGECAFNSWRRLPRGFVPAYNRRLLAVWRAAPHPERMQLGGPLFRLLAAVFGRVGAGRLLRLRNAAYTSIRTLDDVALKRLS